MPDITAARPVSGAPVASAWGGQVHDLVEGVQAGVATIPTITAGNGTVAVVFPRAYASAPNVVVTAPGNSFFMAQVGQITPTGFTVYVRDLRDAQAGTGSALPCQWIAVGTPA